MVQAKDNLTILGQINNRHDEDSTVIEGQVGEGHNRPFHRLTFDVFHLVDAFSWA